MYLSTKVLLNMHLTVFENNLLQLIFKQSRTPGTRYSDVSRYEPPLACNAYRACFVLSTSAYLIFMDVIDHFNLSIKIFIIRYSKRIGKEINFLG